MEGHSHTMPDISQVQRLVESGAASGRSLRSQSLLIVESLEYLFIHDRVTLEEAQAYLRLSRAAVYRRATKKAGMVREIQKTSLFPARPEWLFDYTEYCSFLEWRDKQHSINTVTIDKAARDIGCTTQNIGYLVKTGKLVVLQDGKVLTTSIRLYLAEQYREVEKRKAHLEQALKIYAGA